MTFSEEIFDKNSKESNKFLFSNTEFKFITNTELQIFGSKDTITENLSDEVIDTLDIENLRSILKAKSQTIQNLEDKTKSITKNFTNLLNEEKEKNDEMRTIIRLQKKEIEQYNENMNELQKELTILKEKENITKTFEISKVNHNMKAADLKKNDFKYSQMVQNILSGDSPVLISSKIENKETDLFSKKWSSFEKKIVIKFQDLEIKFKKIDDVTNSKVNFMLKNGFRFIDVEIYNTSDTALSIDSLNLDSTSKL